MRKRQTGHSKCTFYFPSKSLETRRHAYFLINRALCAISQDQYFRLTYRYLNRSWHLNLHKIILNQSQYFFIQHLISD